MKFILFRNSLFSEIHSIVKFNELRNATCKSDIFYSWGTASLPSQWASPRPVDTDSCHGNAAHSWYRTAAQLCFPGCRTEHTALPTQLKKTSETNNIIKNWEDFCIYLLYIIYRAIYLILFIDIILFIYLILFIEIYI